MSTDRPDAHDGKKKTQLLGIGADGKTALSPGSEAGSTDGGSPEELATVDHLSDSLLGETVLLSGSDSKVIGNFQLTERLGAGGFGVVYAAEDLRLDRRVALKVPFAVKGEEAPEYYKRVVREGRAAAALDHPNIVSIYEVAERSGQPFIVLQLIDGPTLHDRNTSGRMDQYEAAKLMASIVRALAYAHRKGIVHRDMKPGNVLLDEDGVPYVNDFGIAKYESTEETISSENSIIGTPSYMSPEQAAGQSRSADGRSDLYSLGVMLYELITGERPFRGNSRMLLHQVIHSEPQPPRQLVQSIQLDLETICLKCLEKDPNRRYQNCDELANELDRFLNGEAIQARPVSRLEHAWRKCRRYPVASTLAVAFLVSLLGGLAGVTYQWQRAEGNRALEQEARQELAEEVEYSNRLLYGAQMGLAANSIMSGDYQQTNNHLNVSDAGLAKFRDVEYFILQNRVDRYQRLLQHIEQVTDVAISDDESMIAACGLRTLLVWDLESGQVILRAREKGKQLRCVAFAPESDLVAWSGQSGRIEFKSTSTPEQPHATLDHGSGVRAISFSKDGERLLSAGDDGKIVVWSVKTKRRIQSIAAHKGPVNGAQFSGTDRVISGGQDRRICTSEIESGKSSVHTIAPQVVTAIAASNDGKRFAAGLESPRLLIGHVDQPKKAISVVSNASYVVDLEFLEEPDMLVVSHLSGTINVWNLPDMQAARCFRCVKGFGRFAIAQHSSRMIVGAGDGAIEAIRLDEGTLDEVIVECKSLNAATLINDSQAVVVCPDQGPAKVIHLASGRLLRTIPDHSDKSIHAALRQCTILCCDESSDGKKLAFGTDTGQILIWNVEDARLKVHGTAGGRALPFVRLIGDSSTLVSGGENGAIRVWELGRANESTEVARHGSVIRGLEVSPDGNWLAAVAADGSVTRLKVGQWQESKRIETGRTLHCVAWSPDSRQLVIGHSKGGVLIYPNDLLGEPAEMRGHAGPVNCITLSASGETMITGGNDDAIRFWDMQTGQTKMISRIHERNIRSLSLGDGLMLTADVGGRMRIWPANAISDESDLHSTDR